MKDIYIEIPDNFAVEEAGELREKIYDLINKGERDFLCDFSRCRFIDSTGLGVLVSVYKKCMEINGSLKLKDRACKYFCVNPNFFLEIWNNIKIF